jgi:hypothetical protein
MPGAGDWSGLDRKPAHAGSLNAMRSAMCSGSGLLGWLHRPAVQVVADPPCASWMYSSNVDRSTRHWLRPPIWMAGSSPMRTRA